METISAVVIERNEEKNIKECLNSIVNKVDEIIILDTGSIDSTLSQLEKIKTNKIHLYNYLWKDDFADARNYAWQKATQNWILWIDADDRLNSSRDDLEKAIADRRNTEIGLVNITEKKSGHTMPTPRIVKNNFKDLCFFGIIHEEIRARKKLDLKEFNSNINFVHTGYDDNEVVARKKKRNVKLLKRMNKIEPDYQRWVYFLSRDGQGILDPRDIIELILKVTKNFELVDLKYNLGMIENLISASMEVGNINMVYENIQRLAHIYPECVDAEYYMSLMEIQKNINERNVNLQKLYSFRKRMMENQNKSSLINSNGYHLDKLICFLLYDCFRYDDAKKFKEYLDKQGYPSMLSEEQLKMLSVI
ncbi:glycosyltransferase [Pediococcus stilesii]|uniref:Glycosyltransferase n=1 Tax=Pediococcus stilesii TaxID=331679 RepID=A0A5R9BUG3_9LACO|nr:glycosyltransferase [Pediococcus stilesii]TLQ04269.1 glycosyltransferase [Pediococcus stilesii]